MLARGLGLPQCVPTWQDLGKMTSVLASTLQQCVISSMPCCTDVEVYYINAIMPMLCCQTAQCNCTCIDKRFISAKATYATERCNARLHCQSRHNGCALQYSRVITCMCSTQPLWLSQAQDNSTAPAPALLEQKCQALPRAIIAA